MAVVDFSNAVLDVQSDYTTSYKPIEEIRLLLAGSYISSTYLVDLISNTWTSIATTTVTLVSETPSKTTLAFSGTFLYSGTHFYISPNSDNRPVWKVSNISFSEGDIFSFVIDIDITVS